MEILTRSVTNRETTDLENAGLAHLQVREKPLEETKNESDDEGHKSKKGGKKGKKANKGKAEEEAPVKALKETKKEVDIKEVKHEEAKQEEKPVASTISDKKFKCTSCKDAGFDTNSEFRTHFKTDWHNFNLKRKLEKKEPVTEEEFLDQLLDEDLLQKKI